MDSTLSALGVACAVLAGAAAFVALALLFNAVDQVRLRIGRLERAVAAANEAGVSLSRNIETPEVAEDNVAVTPAAGAFAEQDRAQDLFEPAHAWAAATEESPDETVGAAAAAPKQRGAIDWEIFAGGRLLNIVGGFVLVIGVGLALKYAFDQNWISESLRIAAGLVVGAGLLGFAEIVRSRNLHRWFADGVTGTGLGVLYVSGYAAFGSYHLWPFTLAYAFMSCVTIVAFCLALRYDSLAVALLGWAGGFATPFVLNDGSANEVGMASYIVLLDLGLVAIALAKERWFALEPLALTGSYAAAFAWYSWHGDVGSPFVSTIALLSIWGVFFAAGVMRALRLERSAAGGAELLGVANLFVLCAYLLQVLAGHSTAFEYVALGLAAVYAVAYAALLRRRPDASAQRIAWYLSGAALVALATEEHFHDMELATVLVAEGLALATVERVLRLVARRRAATETSIAAAGAMLAGASAFLFGNGAFEHATSWNLTFGSRDFAFLVLIAGGYGLDRLLRAPGAWPEVAGIVLRQSTLIAVLVLAAVHAEGYRLAATYAVLALAAIAVGTRAMLRDFEIDGLALAALASVVALAQPDTWQLQHVFAFVPLANARFEGFAIIALALLGGGEMLRRRSLLPAVPRVLRAAGTLAAVGAVTLDVRDWFERALALARLEPQTAAVIQRLTHLASGEQLAISAAWILASLILITLGVRLRVRDLRLLAIGLFDLTILKAFFVDFDSVETLYRIAIFIGLGLVLLGVSYVYQRLERGFFSVTPRSEEALPA